MFLKEIKKMLKGGGPRLPRATESFPVSKKKGKEKKDVRPHENPGVREREGKSRGGGKKTFFLRKKRKRQKRSRNQLKRGKRRNSRK